LDLNHVFTVNVEDFHDVAVCITQQVLE